MIVLSILLSALLLLLLFAFICYFIVFYSPQKGQNDLHQFPKGEQYDVYMDAMIKQVDAAAALPFEPVSIRSRDGQRLTGRYYHNADGAPVVICFHGYRANAVRDFSGGVQVLRERGINALLIDQRAQGGSSGHTITFGVKERFDCLDWIDYIRNRCGAHTPITLYGISMGAATILMASGLDLPDNVRGIVADCPYDTPKRIICKVCRDLHLPAGIFYPMIALGAMLFGHIRLSDGDALSAVKGAKVPILLIHGEDDRFVPCEMSRILQKSNPAFVTLHTFPGAGHGICYMTDKSRYIALLDAFMEETDTH